MIPIYINHRGKPIGHIIQFIIDEIGIKIVFGVWENIHDQFLSIGFKTRQSIQKGSIRYIFNIDIFEVSIVDFPAQKGTHYVRITRN